MEIGLQVDTGKHVDSSPCVYVHTRARTADSLMHWRGACSGTHTFRNTHRKRLWEVESESSRPELWVVLCPDFRGSTLHFEQGNVWGVAQPSLQLKGQLCGPLSCISPLPGPAVILALTQYASSGLFLPLTLPSAPLSPHRWGKASPLGL